MLNHKVAGHRSIKALVTYIGLICYVRLSGFRHGVYHLEQRTSTSVISCVSKSFCINFLDGVSEFESDHFIFGDRHFRRDQICRPLTKIPEGLGRHCVFKYSETRLLRTLKGNEKRYILTKVRSIQNAIFLTGRTSSTCSRERSATEECFSVLYVVHYSLFVRWNRLSGHRELENVPGNWNRNWKGEWHARDQKKEPKKEQKVLLEGKLARNIWFCATFFTSYPKKKMNMFSDWRCPWSTERTL